MSVKRKLFRKITELAKRKAQSTDSIVVTGLSGQDAIVPVSDITAAAQSDTSKSFHKIFPIDGEFYHDTVGQRQQVWEVSGYIDKMIVTHAGALYPVGHPQYEPDTAKKPTQQMVLNCCAINVNPIDIVSISGTAQRFRIGSQQVEKTSIDAGDVFISEPYIKSDDIPQCKMLFIRPPAFQCEMNQGNRLTVGQSMTENVSMSFAIRFTRDMAVVKARMEEYQANLAENSKFTLDGDRGDVFLSLSVSALGNQHETIDGIKIWVPKYEQTQSETQPGDIAYINNIMGQPVADTSQITSGTFNIKPHSWFENGATIKVVENIVTLVTIPKP